MSHKLSLNGQADVEGKYKNGRSVIFMVEGSVKAEPHLVATATGGNVSKMSVTMGDVIPITDPAEYDAAAKRFVELRMERDGGEQEAML